MHSLHTINRKHQQQKQQNHYKSASQKETQPNTKPHQQHKSKKQQTPSNRAHSNNTVTLQIKDRTEKFSTPRQARIAQNSI